MAAPAGAPGSHMAMIDAGGHPQREAPSTLLLSGSLRARIAATVARMLLPPTFTTSSARAAGLSRSQLRGSAFVRLGHDLFARLDDAIDDRERLGCLATALPADAAFSHATAAALLGAPVALPPIPHVALTPRRVLPQRSDVVVHGRRLTAGDVVLHRGLRLTSAAQTFLDLAATSPPWELVAVGDAFFRAGHLDADVLSERLARADRVRGVVRARACAPMLTPLAMSRPESLMRYWLVTSRLPDPVPQIPVRDRRGLVVAHGDLGYPEWRVVLEYEGRQHAEQEQFGRDIDRYSLMGADGWLVLRFAGRHLGGPTVLLERTRRALVSRGWSPWPG